MTAYSLVPKVRAATAALQGLATGSVEDAVVGALSPYANKWIKENTTTPDQSVNTEANLIAHAILGAVEAHVTGNKVAVGAIGALTAEAAAPYIMQTLYGTDKVENLTDSQKQNVANLSQITAGLSSGLVGDSTASGIAGAEIGKRAVENNYLSAQEAERKRVLEDRFHKGLITSEETAELSEINKKDQESDLALISACEGNPLSLGCHSERQKLERDKFSYSNAKYTPTGYNSPTYTRYSALYPEDYGKVASFSDRYDVLKAARVKADADFYNATGIAPSWFRRAEVANSVVASIAGVKLSTTQANKTNQVVPKSVNANEKLPVVGKTADYENQTTRISTGAENVALYPKLKEQLMMDNIYSIGNLDPKLREITERLGKKTNYGIDGIYSTSEANRLGMLWVGNNASDIVERGIIKGWVSQDNTRVYRFPSGKPNAKESITKFQENFETFKIDPISKEKTKIGNAHLDIKD